MNESNQIILGIDPGSLFMGYAVIHVCDSKLKLITMDVIRLNVKKDMYTRLGMIHKKICDLIAEHKPSAFAIEAPFYGKNIQSMLKLGRAQGVAIAAAMQSKIEVTEYSPRKIKQSITGRGNADKEQIWKMLQQILSLENKPKHYDATDALAVALCHYFQTKSVVNKSFSKNKGWNEFIKNNPERIKK